MIGDSEILDEVYLDVYALIDMIEAGSGSDDTKLAVVLARLNLIIDLIDENGKSSRRFSVVIPRTSA